MEAFIESWGPLGVFLAIIATGLGFPMPEELPVVIGGGLAGHRSYDTGFMFLMMLACIAGVIIGDGCLYLIGRIWGSRLVGTSFFQKHVLSPERLASVTENFHKYGIKILLFARLTPGIRTPIFLTAGITKLSWIRFVIADGLYAIPGVSILFFLGFFFTERMIALVNEKAEIVKAVSILGVLAIVAGYFVYRFVRKPMVTGSPAEVPKIMEPVSFGVDQVTAKILHPESNASTNDPQSSSADIPGVSRETVRPPVAPLPGSPNADR